MNGLKEMPRSCANNSQGGEQNTNNYTTSDKYLTAEDVERLFGCTPEELCPDMLARLPEMLVIPEWESW